MPPDSSDLSRDAIEDQFPKCSPETIDAIYAFKQRRDPELVPTIVQGITRKYLNEEKVAKLSASGGAARLAALGADSLTLMELTLDVQDALDVSISDEEMRGVETLDDISALLRSKLSA